MSGRRWLRPSRARTDRDVADRRMRTRCYAVAFREVWEEVEWLVGKLPRWTLRGSDARAGEIRAEARTLVCRFTDDVTIRVHLDGGGMTCVDVESASRIGWYDFGTNGLRIRRFLRRLDRRMARRPQAAVALAAP
jgi:uncharacterized protein (DUF1499 family)